MENFHRMDACPVRDVLSRLGDKWTMLVLVTLKANGTMRFCDIQKTIGDISQRMLTVTLRSLETDGLIVRKVYAEVPPRVEYNLTRAARSECSPPFHKGCPVQCSTNEKKIQSLSTEEDRSARKKALRSLLMS